MFKIEKFICYFSLFLFLGCSITDHEDTGILFLLLFLIFFIIYRKNQKKINEKIDFNILSEETPKEPEKFNDLPLPPKINSEKVTVYKEEKKNISKPKTLLQSDEKEQLKQINSLFYSIPNLSILNYNEDFPNCLLEYLTSKASAHFVRFAILDMQKLSFINFKKYNHLLVPVVTDARKATLLLENMIKEIDRRCLLLTEKENRNIEIYNNEVEYQEDVLPYLIVFVNDAYNYILEVKEGNFLLENLILNGNKVGIKFILFSQIPFKHLKLDVVANSLTKYNQEECFQYFTNLLKDLNFSENENEVWVPLDIFIEEPQSDFYDGNIAHDTDDPIYDEVVEFAIEMRYVSASLLQRRFHLGYNRAARIIDLLEERGIIGPQIGSKPREVLVKLKNEDGVE